MKCTAVNLLPVANKQNQIEFMQKAMSTLRCLREPYTQTHNANGRARAQYAGRSLNIYRMHFTINIVQIEWNRGK